MASRKEGTSLGPYRLIEQIGLGGMATVYKAYQPSMDRYIALKVLPPYYAQDPKFIERFNREARTIARLEHKNILPVYDFGEENGVTYLAMRYLDGGTLKDMLALGRLTLSDAVDILCQVCAALDYAHRQGVVHRDVKPANIMIDGEGAAYLTDFGIAKVLEAAPGGLTETGAAIGTPAYMAPEQSLGQAVDRRSDIYALGVILYEMVVGRAPYQADTPMAVALAHIHEPLPLPREIDPAIPEPLERVILKALAKNPNERYQHTCDMSDALSAALVESGVSRGDTTLRALATQARDQIASQTIKVTPETFAPARAAGVTAPPQVRRGLSPLAIGGIVVGGLAVLALVVAIVPRLAPAAIVPSATAHSPTAEPTSVQVANTQPPAAQPAATSNVYDNFDNATYDGSFDHSLWMENDWDTCAFKQTSGEMIVKNEPADKELDCRLNVGRPTRVDPSEMGTLQSRLKISNTGTQGGSFSSITMRGYYPTPNDQIWQFSCGLVADPASTQAKFEIQNVTQSSYTFQTADTRDWTAESDRWYTFQVKLDPATMVITCLIDGKVLASAVPENAVGVKGQLIERGLESWRSAQGASIAAADDFTILPPETK